MWAAPRVTSRPSQGMSAWRASSGKRASRSCAASSFARAARASPTGPRCAHAFCRTCAHSRTSACSRRTPLPRDTRPPSAPSSWSSGPRCSPTPSSARRWRPRPPRPPSAPCGPSAARASGPQLSYRAGSSAAWRARVWIARAPTPSSAPACRSPPRSDSRSGASEGSWGSSPWRGMRAPCARSSDCLRSCAASGTGSSRGPCAGSWPCWTCHATSPPSPWISSARCPTSRARGSRACASGRRR